MSVPIRIRAYVVAALMLLAPPAASAQVIVTAVLDDEGSGLERTDQVELVRWGSLQGEVLRRGESLEVGDELRARDLTIDVELTCADTAVFTLTGAFRVAVGSLSAPCTVDLGAGELHVMGDANTGVDVGGVVMGAVRTVYKVTAGRDADGPVRRLAVFEGGVEVRGIADEPVPVAPRRVLYAAREPRWDSVGDADVAAAARLYTRMDYARASPAARTPAAYDDLYRAHVRVLENPGDAASRVHLVNEQVRVNATSRATLYHIQWTERAPRRTSEVETATAALAAVAYLQLDRPDDAAARAGRYEAATQQDQRAALARYQIDPAAVSLAVDAATRRAPAADYARDTVAVARPDAGRTRYQPELVARVLAVDSLRVEAAASPATTGAGQWVRVVVRVRAPDGSAVAGAEISVGAVGGEFRGTLRPAATGVTDRNGVFDTAWRCQRCAQAYTLEVRAGKRGYAGAETTVGVRVRR